MYSMSIHEDILRQIESDGKSKFFAYFFANAQFPPSAQWFLSRSI